MSQRSFHVCWIPLGFLLSLGVMGLLAKLIPSAWLVPYIIVTTSVLLAAGFTYFYFFFVNPSAKIRPRAIVWSSPVEEGVDSSTPISVETLVPADARPGSSYEPRDGDDLGDRIYTDEEWKQVITHAQFDTPDLDIVDIPLHGSDPDKS